MADPQKNPCSGCGESVLSTETACPACGADLVGKAPVTDPKAIQGDATGGLIPYKNAPALIAYYCGVFSVLAIVPIFFPIPVIAFILGIKGLKVRKKNPQVKGAVHAWIGIIMGGLFTLISGGLIGLFIFGMASA